METTLPHRSMGTVPDPLPAAKPSLIAASETKEDLGDNQPPSPGQTPQCPHTHGLCNVLGKTDISKESAHSLMQTRGPEPAPLHLPAALGTFHKPETKASPSLSSQLPRATLDCSGSPGPHPIVGEGLPAQAETMPAHQHAHQAMLEDPLVPRPSIGSAVPLETPQKTPDAESPNTAHCPAGDIRNNSQDEAPCDCPSREANQGAASITEVASRACGEEGDSQAALGGAQGSAPQTPAPEEKCPGSTLPSATAKDTVMSESLPSSQVPSPASPLPREQQASRFKEASTMTPQADSTPGGGPRLQDAGVQAVASVQSKSVSTSPSILAAFLKGAPVPRAMELQEELRVLCCSSGGHTLELTDSELGHSDSGACPHALQVQVAFPGERLSTRAPLEALKASPMTQVSPASTQDPCKESDKTSGVTPTKAQLESVQLTGANACSNEQVSVNAGIHLQGSSEAKPSEAPVKTSSGHKPDPDCNVPQASDSTHQAWQISNSEPRDEREKSLAPQGMATQESRGANSLEAGDKAEAKSGLLSPVSPVPAPSPARKAQEGAEDSAQSKASSLGLGLGLSVDSSPGSGKRTPARSVKASPRRASRVSEFLKEQRLNVSAAAAQVGLTQGGEKKKQPDPKLHLKQSKRVRDVVWDEQGMTWEVYGASLDPESLGIAIQNHLQRQIREHEKFIKAQGSQSRRSISSEASSNKRLKGRQHSVLQAILQNFRRPNCCVRPAASSVLD